MKQLWIGQLAIGGTITVPELPYYNLLAIVNTSNETGFAIRVPGEWFKGIIPSGESYGNYWFNMFSIEVNGTSLTLSNGIAVSFLYSSNTYTPNSPVNLVRIYGIL